MERANIYKQIESANLTEREKEELKKTIRIVFQGDLDAYQNFSALIKNLNVENLNQFYQNLVDYLAARQSIEGSRKVLTDEIKLLEDEFNRIKNSCVNTKRKLDEIIHVKNLIVRAMKEIDSDEMQGKVKDRDDEINTIQEKIEQIKKREEALKQKQSDISSENNNLKKVWKSIRLKRRQRKLAEERENHENNLSKYSVKSNVVMSSFYDIVDSITDDEKEAILKYKDLVGYEHFFAIKADLVWYLNKKEHGRLISFIDSLSDIEQGVRKTLSDKMSIAEGIKGRIDLKKDIINHPENHLDSYDIPAYLKRVFKDYTSRYPSVSSLSLDDVYTLYEYREAADIVGMIPESKDKVLKLEHEI